MLQSQNFQSFFKGTQIQLDLQYPQSSSFIYSVNKNLFGIYHEFQHQCFFDQPPNKPPAIVDGELIIFQLKEGKWKEYLRKKIKSNESVELLHFVNNTNQLLFYQKWTNCIECLNINESNILGLYKYQSGSIKPYFQFQTFKEFQVHMIACEQKILIKTDKYYFMFDVNQHIIISKFDRNLNYELKMVFFDQNHLVSINNCFEDIGSIKFFNIRKNKAMKVLYSNIFLKYVIYQLNKSLAFISEYQPQKNYATIIDFISLKVIRKTNIKLESFSIYLGFTKRYLLHQHKINKSNYLLYVIDLYSQDIQKFEMNKLSLYKNNILMQMEAPKRNFSSCQFWITN